MSSPSGLSTSLIMVALCSLAGCMEQFAPIGDSAKPCALDADCPLSFFCVSDEGKKRCLRAATERCGDGETNGVEACDDGNRDDADGCRNNCNLAACGDGVRRTDLAQGAEDFEACDDGNEVETDACSRDCAAASCGDGFLRGDLAQGDEGYEACDDGNQDQRDACANNCVAARCGDGIRRIDLPNDHDDYEACDDGNEEAGDGCDGDCKAEACGNSHVDEGETCDDGNQVDDDACRNSCAQARCGDGVVRRDLSLQSEPGFEACDGQDLCSDDCLWDFDLVPLEMVPEQIWTVGSPEDEPNRGGAEIEHQVRLTRAFAIGRTEVTQAQFELIMQHNPSYYVAPNLPVEQVTWIAAVEFANAASRANGLLPCYAIEIVEQVRVITLPNDLDCLGYRLPTEHEWEVAARAGEQHRWSGSDTPDEVGWFDRPRESTEPVGQKQPNAWGLYDMSGNVREWVWDQHAEYPVGHLVDPPVYLLTDPQGPDTDNLRTYRVYRGGSWPYNASFARVAFRFGAFPENAQGSVQGFRLTKTIPSP